MREMLKNDLLLLMNKYMDTSSLQMITKELEIVLSNYEIDQRKTEIVQYGMPIPESVQNYIVSKKIAGLSKKTLYLYYIVLKDFFEATDKPQNKITANDIKVYLYQYQKERKVSNRTLDSKRTVICTYFGWAAAEGYLDKNPAINVAPIKYTRRRKKPMTQMDLEKMRQACETTREKAIVEMLYSTGCRVTELERLNISDINFEEKEVYLFGKGDQYRTSFLTAKAEVVLKEYLQDRTDNNSALFVSERKPYARLKKPGIELIIKKIEKRISNISTHVTPHIFRHTTATLALRRGMTLVQVSEVLGHKRIETTMEYIENDKKLLKDKHLNCIM